MNRDEATKRKAMKPITRHRLPGDKLNDNLIIERDERDPNAGNGSHEYTFVRDDSSTPIAVGHLQFQHGPRNEEGSTHGLTGASVIAALIDHYEGFQEGEFRCRENALIITKLEEALHWAQSRHLDRMRRGVLGKSEK
jgi:hypothetical protein